MLDIEIPKDTPLFRASLSNLEHRAHLLSKSCKSTLLSAQQVVDCLEALRKAEGALLEDLERLDGLLSSGSGSGSNKDDGEEHFDVDGATGASDTKNTDSGAGVVRDVKSWLIRRREEEKERLEGVLMSRLRGLKSHLKGRGVGNGVALGGFEVNLNWTIGSGCLSVVWGLIL
jgi:hypothetical protein